MADVGRSRPCRGTLKPPHVRGSSRPIERERRLSSLAAGQGRAVGRDQLLRIGFTREAISHRLQSERLQPLPPQRLRRRSRPAQPIRRALRGATRLPPRSPHQPSQLAGPDGSRQGTGQSIHVTTTNRNGPRNLRGVTVHRVRRLDPADVTRIDDLPCTTLPRSLLDIAETEPRYDAREGLRGRRPQGRARPGGDPGLRRAQSRAPGHQAPPLPRCRVRRHARLPRGHGAGVPAPAQGGGLAAPSLQRARPWPARRLPLARRRLRGRARQQGLSQGAGPPASATWFATRTCSASESRPCASPGAGCTESAPTLVGGHPPATPGAAPRFGRFASRVRRPRDPRPVPAHRRAGAGVDRDLRAARRLHGAEARVPRDRAAGSADRARGLGPARPRRRRVLDGQEGGLPAARGHGQVPLLQRGRVRAGRVQGPRADVQEPAPARRGGGDRRARRRRHPRVHLHPRRVRRGRRPARGRGRARPTRRATSARTSCARGPTSASSSTAAPAPTSAARRRRCSTRSRASAATRG